MIIPVQQSKRFNAFAAAEWLMHAYPEMQPFRIKWLETPSGLAVEIVLPDDQQRSVRAYCALRDAVKGALADGTMVSA